MSDLDDTLRNVLYKSNLIERRCSVISDIELLELYHNKPGRGSRNISRNIGLKVNTIYKKVSKGIQKLNRLLGGII